MKPFRLKKNLIQIVQILKEPHHTEQNGLKDEGKENFCFSVCWGSFKICALVLNHTMSVHKYFWVFLNQKITF